MDGPRSKEPAGRTTSDGYGIKADERYYLKLNPDSLGPQHDEHEPGWFGGRFKWAEACGRSSPRRSCIPASSNGSQRKLACSTTTRPRHTGPGTSAAPQADGLLHRTASVGGAPLAARCSLSRRRRGTHFHLQWTHFPLQYARHPAWTTISIIRIRYIMEYLYI